MSAPHRRTHLPPFPYGMCEADARLYDEDGQPEEMAHDACAVVARWRDDQLFAGAKGDPA